jgi:hypothetical protein
MTEAVEIALIAAIPPTIVSLGAVVLGLMNHKKITTVEINTNNMLTRVTDERNKATTRADTAEGHAAGRIEGVAAQNSEKEK